MKTAVGQSALQEPVEETTQVVADAVLTWPADDVASFVAPAAERKTNTEAPLPMLAAVSALVHCEDSLATWDLRIQAVLCGHGCTLGIAVEIEPDEFVNDTISWVAMERELTIEVRLCLMNSDAKILRTLVASPPFMFQTTRNSRHVLSPSPQPRPEASYSVPSACQNLAPGHILCAGVHVVMTRSERIREESEHLLLRQARTLDATHKAIEPDTCFVFAGDDKDEDSQRSTMWAHSDVLNGLPYFDAMLHGDFTEGEKVPVEIHTSSARPMANEHLPVQQAHLVHISDFDSKTYALLARNVYGADCLQFWTQKKEVDRKQISDLGLLADKVDFKLLEKAVAADLDSPPCHREVVTLGPAQFVDSVEVDPRISHYLLERPCAPASPDGSPISIICAQCRAFEDTWTATKVAKWRSFESTVNSQCNLKIEAQQLHKSYRASWELLLDDVPQQTRAKGPWPIISFELTVDSSKRLIATCYSEDNILGEEDNTAELAIEILRPHKTDLEGVLGDLEDGRNIYEHIRRWPRVQLPPFPKANIALVSRDDNKDCSVFSAELCDLNNFLKQNPTLTELTIELQFREVDSAQRQEYLLSHQFSVNAFWKKFSQT